MYVPEISEKLHIKLGISGTYWKKVPAYNILFNGEIIKTGTITSASNEVEYVEFDVNSGPDDSVLGIELLNKEDSDVLKDSYTDSSVFNIIGDMILNIVSIEIDEIDLGHIIYDHGIYSVNTPVDYNGDGNPVKDIKKCINLGWNGTWRLTWTNPFYVWLLEKI